jgi:ring-1,2-phenylacetyl-CoA epoxidase subunit PaaD
MVIATSVPDLDLAREVVSRVVDPEIPVLTIAELGILNELSIEDDSVLVTITPTYSGCPALHQIEDDIISALEDAGFEQVVVRTTNSPVWTTDRMGPEARAKLLEFGIAPPSPATEVLCPHCAASAPNVVARFGSTACKALMVCARCGEPFDWFKEF